MYKYGENDFFFIIIFLFSFNVNHIHFYLCVKIVLNFLT